MNDREGSKISKIWWRHLWMRYLTKPYIYRKIKCLLHIVCESFNKTMIIFTPLANENPIEWPERIILFGSKENLKNLAESETVGWDGTWLKRELPDMFDQFSTIQGHRFHRSFPFLYAFTSRRTEEHYIRLILKTIELVVSFLLCLRYYCEMQFLKKKYLAKKVHLNLFL